MIYEAKTFGWFLRKIAIDYVRYGYFFYSVGPVPQRKDSKIFDEKMLRKYEITFHRTTRARRKKEGTAVFAYVRFGKKMVLLSTEGTHPAFETWDYKDCRIQPIQLSGYTIGVHAGKPSVRFSMKRFNGLRKFLLGIALHNDKKIAAFFSSVAPYHPFPGVVAQKKKLLKLVNDKRKAGGLKRVKLALSSQEKLYRSKATPKPSRMPCKPSKKSRKGNTALRGS
jgi:hypothetical protein